MEKQICFVPDVLSVYGESDDIKVPALTEEEIIINQWLDERGVHMADPLDIAHVYFAKKKNEIRKVVDKKKTSNLWERRKEKAKTIQSSFQMKSPFQIKSCILSKSSQSSDDGSSGFFE